jgi:formate hydrogenlyase transcriptional activator
VTPPELNDLRVVNAIPAHIWRSAPDGAVQFVNQQWMDYTGLSQENSQGWGWVSVIHHDDRPELLDTWRRVLEAGQPKEAEARFRRFDGEYRWYLIRMVPIRDESGALLGWYGTNTDIDDLKQAQMKLRQDEKELRQMTDATQLPIIVFSAEGRLLYANRFSLTYGGLSLEDFQRDGWRERVYHPDDIEAFADARRAGLARSAPFESEVRIGVLRTAPTAGFSFDTTPFWMMTGT